MSVGLDFWNHPSELSAMRNQFDTDLRALRVDCFTLYVQDLWFLDRYIPQDVDPALFYPEPVYNAPPAAYFLNFLQPNLQRVNRFANAGFFDESHRLCRRRENPLQKRFSKFAPLFSNFPEREEIRSWALFSASREPADPRVLPTFLSLSFRTSQKFPPPHRLALTNLAIEMMRSAEIRTEDQKDRWYLPLLRSVRRIAALQQVIGRYPTRALFDRQQEFYEDVLQQCFRLVADPTVSESKAGVASIHLFRSGDQLELIDEARMWPKSLKQDRESDLNTRQICDGQETSITMCAALTGRSHLLNYVDRANESSVPLTEGEYRFLNLHFDSFPTETSAFRLERPEFAGRRPKPYRLIVTGRLDRANVGNLIATIKSKKAERLTPVLEKLLRRSSMQYSHIFKPLRKDWPLPSSEICLPIIHEGQAIGCINLESAETHQFYPVVGNVLALAASIVGSHIVRTRSEKAMRTTRTATQTLLERTSDLADVLDTFVRDAQRDLLCDRIDVCVRTADSTCPYRVIASTDLKQKSHMLRPAGWTNYVANEIRLPDHGIVLVAVTVNGSFEVSQGYFVRERERISSGDRTNAIGDRESPFYLKPFATLPVAEINHLFHGGRGRLLVAVPLRHHPDGSENPIVLGVMWCTFYDEGPVSAATDHPSTAIDINRYIEQILAVAEHCVLVPQVYQSYTLMTSEFHHLLWHEEISDRFLSSRSRIQKALRSQVAIDLLPDELLESLESVRLQIEYLHGKSLVFADLLSGASQSLAGDRAKLDVFIDECWKTAKLSIEVKGCTHDIDRACSAFEVVGSDCLRVLLVNIFTNSLKWGLKKLPPDQRVDYAMVGKVCISAKEIEEGNLRYCEVRITDSGDGYPAEQLRLAAEWERSPSVMPLWARKKGMILIEKLSHKLSDGRFAKCSNKENGGASTEFRIRL